MVGIEAYGAYIPKSRLAREEMAKSWGIPGALGEIAVANFDEDSLTMAVDACRDCILDNPEGVEGLYFASTTAPYLEKAASTTVASVLDLEKDAFTADFAASLSAGMAALIAAINLVGDKTANSALVAAAECRVAEPRTAEEQTFGDAAAALLISDEDVIAEVKGVHAHYEEVMGTWRMQGDRRIRDYNPRFYTSKGYAPSMIEALTRAVEKFEVKPEDITKVVYAAPDFRSHNRIAKSLKLDAKGGQVQDALFVFVGGCGAAQPLLMLAAALEEANPGDKILLAGMGDSFDVILLEVTDKIKDFAPLRGVKGHLGSKQMIPSYAKYLRYRDLVDMNAPQEETSSPIQMWRDRKALLPLCGMKCNNCGEVSYPPSRVCRNCRTMDDWEYVRLARKGKLFNYIHDNLYPNIEAPTTMTITDLEDGGRIYLQMTDREVDEVELGMDVELVFRKLHEGGNFHNYYWKTRPVR